MGEEEDECEERDREIDGRLLVAGLKRERKRGE
jgi:hypothetical protein